MTTIVVTNCFVLVDTRTTHDSSFCTRTKLNQYKGMVYTSSGTVGSGQIDIYQFIDKLLGQSESWPDAPRCENANAWYVLVATQPIPHRGIGKGDVIFIDVVSGEVCHDSFDNKFDIAYEGIQHHITVCTLGSGGSLYHAFLAETGEPSIAFEKAVTHDLYSGYPYQRLNRSTCEVTLVEESQFETVTFPRLRNVAGLQITPEA